MNSLRKTSLARVLCENGDHIDYIPRNVFLNAVYPRDYVACSLIEDIDLEPWRGCCNDNMAGSNMGKTIRFSFLVCKYLNKQFFLSVCKTPAILTYDPFPDYESSTNNTGTRQKREVLQEETNVNDDTSELEKLRQQVANVLKKVRKIHFY